VRACVCVCTLYGFCADRIDVSHIQSPQQQGIIIAFHITYTLTDPLRLLNGPRGNV